MAVTKESRIKIDRAIEVRADQIVPNDYNPNKTSETVDKAISESMEYFGQVQELIVRPNPKNRDQYIIIDGEHRWNLADRDQTLFVNIIYGLTEAEAKKLTIIAKETQGTVARVDLSRLLSSIYDDLDDKEEFSIGLPYEPMALSELVSMGSLKEWDNYEEEDDGSYQVAGLSTNNSHLHETGFQANPLSNQTYEKETNTSTQTKTTITQNSDHSFPFAVKLTQEEKDLFLQVRDLVSQEIELTSKDNALSNGQVIMKLVRDYLGK